MSELLSGIKFVSKAEIDEKKRLAKEAQERRDVEAKEAAKERRHAVKAAAASGESKWLAPALERRLGGGGGGGGGEEDGRDGSDKHRHKHKSDKHKSDKHKHRKEKKKHKHHRHREGAGGEAPAAADNSASSDDDEVAGDDPAASAASEAMPPPSRGVAVAGDAGRSAAGLDWMMRAPARPAKAEGASETAAAAAAALGAGSAGVGDDAAAAAAPAPARIVRELNPYAREGAEVNDWTAQAAGHGDAAPVAAVRAAGTDGGQSWQAKKLRRAVEEAQCSGVSLQQVCMERWGDLGHLGELEAIAREMSAQNGVVKGKGKGKGGADLYAHLRAGAARARDTPPKRRGEESSLLGGDESGKGGKGGGKGGKGKGEGKGGGEGKGKGEGKGEGKGKGRGEDDGTTSFDREELGGQSGGGKGKGRGAMQRPKLAASLAWDQAIASAGAPAPSQPAKPNNAFANDGSFLASLERQSFLYGGREKEQAGEALGSGGGSEAAVQKTAADTATDEDKAWLTAGADMEVLEGDAAVEAAEAAAEEAAEAVAEAEAPAAPIVAAEAPRAASGSGDVDLNKLAAKAMKAKLVGNLAEHARLTALIEQVRYPSPLNLPSISPDFA